MLRVGCIPYLHCELFYVDMRRRGIALHEMVPSAVATAMLEGEIDGGPVPLVDCFRLEDRLQPVAGFCVATVKQAGSILLYSTRPLEALDGAHIGVTDEAVTAQQLLHVLLRGKYHVQPAAYVPLEAAREAFLLIGNRALCQRMGAPGFPYLYDLGEVWHAWTGLPFVFSRWMARKDLDPKARALLEDTLYVALEDGIDQLFRIAEPRDDVLMLPRDIVKYIRGFRYYISMNEQQAIDQFRHYVQQFA